MYGNHDSSGFAEHVSATLSKPAAATPLILLMGFIGASLRYILETVFPANGGFPWATLLVNIFGCFVLEIINQYVGRRLHLPAPLVKSLGVGLIGAFTTIAAFSTECATFLHNGAYIFATIYIAATLATTFASAFAGRAFSQYLAYRRLSRLQREHALGIRGRKPSAGECKDAVSFSVVKEPDNAAKHEKDGGK